MRLLGLTVFCLSTALIHAITSTTVSNIFACGSNPCQNSGVCIDEASQYTCNCTQYWVGTDCDIDIDECSLIPCSNNGTCTNFPGSYQCACLTGWTGDNCDLESSTSGLSATVVLALIPVALAKIVFV